LQVKRGERNLFCRANGLIHAFKQHLRASSALFSIKTEMVKEAPPESAMYRALLQ
jgi:hypothetical protein